MSLAEARERKAGIRGKARSDGNGNPFASAVPTFAAMADILQEEKAWDDHTAKTFRRNIDRHALPRIRVPVDEVAAHHVRDALATTKYPTTKIAVCRAISQVLDKAVGDGYRTTINPCPPMIRDLER